MSNPTITAPSTPQVTHLPWCANQCKTDIDVTLTPAGEIAEILHERIVGTATSRGGDHPLTTYTTTIMIEMWEDEETPTIALETSRDGAPEHPTEQQRQEALGDTDQRTAMRFLADYWLGTADRQRQTYTADQLRQLIALEMRALELLEGGAR